MELSELRKEIDAVDRQIIDLFCRRMEISEHIGNYKREHGLAVYDPIREAQKLEAIAQSAPSEMSEYLKRLYSLLFALSKEYQSEKQEK